MKQASFHELVKAGRIPRGKPPSFSTSPRCRKSRYIFEGDRIILKVKIFGSPAPKIEWKLNKKDIFQDKRVSIIKNRSFTEVCVTQCNFSDGGVYTVILTNICGGTCNSFTIHVKPRNESNGDHNA